MKGWIEIGDVTIPIVGIELHQGRFTVIGRTKGPLVAQDPQFPVIVGHDGIPVYTCSSRVDVPKVSRWDNFDVTLDVTVYPLEQPAASRSSVGGKVFT